MDPVSASILAVAAIAAGPVMDQFQTMSSAQQQYNQMRDSQNYASVGRSSSLGGAASVPPAPPQTPVYPKRRPRVFDGENVSQGRNWNFIPYQPDLSAGNVPTVTARSTAFDRIRSYFNIRRPRHRRLRRRFVR